MFLGLILVVGIGRFIGFLIFLEFWEVTCLEVLKLIVSIYVLVFNYFVVLVYLTGVVFFLGILRFYEKI